ncbi:MAG TPA: thermonuclease family protein [Alphaproteobacteria bacterium]|nr:thermonuclease family protein [Alphaproteobacteria bacterium]
MNTAVRHGVWLGFFAVLMAAPAAAELVRAGSGVVREVVDGDTVILEDGREIRLVGIQAPKLPLGRPNFREWPLAREAKAALEAMVKGKRVTLSFGGRRRDRYRRWLAHLHLDGSAGSKGKEIAAGAGHWVQGQLLSRGLARVYSFADNRAAIAEMLARERAARAAKRGIWGHAYYGILDHGAAGRRLNSFQLVEGRILVVAPTRSRTFLNFGQNWRTDFTIVIARRNLRHFKDRGRVLVKLAGKRVRVRGWLKRRNGPMMAVTHPEQIEVLER